ncbi:MAG: hypothetical protein HY730_09135 [Candidatus Tectomicrobia bacterium]|uniref:Uncharacterized protein n=1 Tax=Tectimicrobiota bacterium TaxID=2528274 RepID=A0A933LQT7_UNCTE|nr:hypothetical protein [Candidatus Tectomicrobia bacterium]
MTYVNHITQGAGWNEVNEIGGIFPDFTFRLKDKRFLPGPEVINWRTTFTLPDKAGRLHVIIRNGRSRDNNLPIIIMELTVRGMGTDKSIEGMQGWFDMAREWIVHGSTDLTSEQIQKEIWGKK